MAIIDHDINVTGSSSLYRRQDGSSTDCHFHPILWLSNCAIDQANQEMMEAVDCCNSLRMCTDLRLFDNLPIDHFDGSVSWKVTSMRSSDSSRHVVLKRYNILLNRQCYLTSTIWVGEQFVMPKQISNRSPTKLRKSISEHLDLGIASN